MESATSKTSFMLCETSTTARPASASRRTSCSTCSVCATPRAAVGSSRMTSLEFHSTARAMATVCRWPPDRLATCWRMDRTVRTDRQASTSAARVSMADSSSRMPFLSSRPEEHVVDDVEVVAQREVLVDDLDAERRSASAGDEMCVGSPSKRTSPASNGKIPAMHLIIVDLPAPLSPTSAVTSPARATRSTPRSACTAPKFLRPPRTSSVGGGARSGAACAACVIVHLVVSLGSPRVVAGLCGRAARLVARRSSPDARPGPAALADRPRLVTGVAGSSHPGVVRQEMPASAHLAASSAVQTFSLVV